MAENSPTDQVAAAENGEGTQRTVFDRLSNSTVQQVREANDIMETLVNVLAGAAEFASGQDATEEQAVDVALLFDFIIGYFNGVDDLLTEMAVENLLRSFNDALGEDEPSIGS
jgi:hypothetical protein